MLDARSPGKVRPNSRQWNRSVEDRQEAGGEIIRLWVASVDFQEDVTVSEDLMKQVAENYRKVRNTFKYLLSNLRTSICAARGELR